MNKSKIVSIGGVEYDSHTGLPVTKQAAVKVATPQKTRNVQPVHAKGVHSAQQRSATLNRRFVAKKTAATPAPAKKPVMSGMVVSRKSTKGTPASQLHVRSKSLDIRPKTRSAHISKFAKEPQALAVKRPVASNDIAHTPHPLAKKAHAAQAVRQQAATPPVHHTPSAKDIKHAELGKALAHAKADAKAPKQAPRRALNIAAASLGLLLIAGYFTYVNMPNLSVRVAAAQAGIEASYPEYRPVGYSLNGPVAYQDGEVSMKFASNTGPVAFQLSQAKSGWDSAALLEKFVNPESNSKYATYNDGGLTIYTYGTNAAWVNGGILFTIEGDANLSNEQIRRIATSM